MKRGLPALTFKAAVIAPIIVKPQAKKDRRHNQTVKYSGAGEIKHALELGRGAVGGARISMQQSPRPSSYSWKVTLGFGSYFFTKIKTRRQ